MGAVGAVGPSEESVRGEEAHGRGARGGRALPRHHHARLVAAEQQLGVAAVRQADHMQRTKTINALKSCQ